MASRNQKLWRMSKPALKRLRDASLEQAVKMEWDIRRWGMIPGFAAKRTIRHYRKQAEACEEELWRRKHRRPVPRAPSKHSMTLRSRKQIKK